MKLPRARLTGLAASALTVLSLCVAPAASATLPLQSNGFACYVEEINDDEGSFACDYAWTGGTGPYTVTARSGTYASVDWVVVNGESASIYGWCRVDKVFRVYATVTDSTGASASTVREYRCRTTYNP